MKYTNKLLAMFLILSMLSSMGAATTDTEAANRTFAYALEKYLSIPEGLFRAVEVGAVSYSYICLSIICILLMPMLVMQLKKRKTVAWIAAVLSFAAIFPITSKVFNGFSYPAGRWYYVLTFFLTWACMECLNRETLSNKKSRLIMGGWLAFLVAWVAAMYFIIGIGSKGALAAALGGGVCGALMIACIAIYFDRCSNAKQRKTVQFIGGLILVGAIACSANMKLLPGNYTGDYLRFGGSADRVAASSERVIDRLYEEDGDLYRTDIAYRTNRKLHSKLRVNSNLIYNNRSVYTYSSLLDSRVNRFCSVIGNNYGCFARLAMISNDNRPCPDFLLGVRYSLGNNRYEKNASEYAGHDFEKYADIDDVEVLRSRRSIGIGTSFTSYITESELMSMPQLVRDQIMMQTAVVPDDKTDAVKGVSCLDSLEKAFPLLVSHAVPGLAIALNDAGCINTHVDNTYVEELLTASAPEGHALLDHDAIRRQIDNWFKREELECIFGRQNDKTSRVCLDWMITGGKRWRPYLLCAVYQAITGDTRMNEDVHRAAVAVECFHKASLIHDDIEDKDDARYGQPTVNALYGDAYAINAGDALLGEGYRILARSNNMELVRLIADAHASLCKGQGAELEWCAAPHPIDMDFSLEIFKNKTVPAFEVSLLLGLACTGNHIHLRPMLKAYSEALGIAYQLKDDMEDFCQDNELAVRPSAVLALRTMHSDWDDERVKEELQRMVSQYKQQALDALDSLDCLELKRLLYQVTEKILK